MIDYSKKIIRGLCFTDDVFDDNGCKRSVLIFDNNCNPIDLANKYIKYCRQTQTGSYCTISIIARDLSRVYDFLLISDSNIFQIKLDILKEFVGYLKKNKVKYAKELDTEFVKVKYSIERTLRNRLSIIEKKSSRSGNVTHLNINCGIDEQSIYRTFNRLIRYIKYLNENYDFDFNYIVEYFDNKYAVRNFLRAQGIEIHNHEIKPVDEEMILLDDEIQAINEHSTTPYERLLYFLLERTGMRIGEALGLKMVNYDKNDIRKYDGDINFQAGRWVVNIIWRPENPFFCRTKSHRARAIELKKNETRIFELLFERYLKWRGKNVNGKSKEWLFISIRGNHLTQNVAYSQLKRTCTKAFLEHRKNEITLHSFRHTFASKELLRGVPLEVISKILGHKNSKTTEEIYIHFTKNSTRKIREDLDEEMEKELK